MPQSEMRFSLATVESSAAGYGGGGKCDGMSERREASSGTKVDLAQISARRATLTVSARHSGARVKRSSVCMYGYHDGPTHCYTAGHGHLRSRGCFIAPPVLAASAGLGARVSGGGGKVAQRHGDADALVD